MNYYWYRVYGLLVKSEIELTELITDEPSTPDVEIQYGNVPYKLPHFDDSGVLFQVTNNDFLFRMEDVGSFRVQNGTLLTIEPDLSPDFSPDLMKVFLMGSVFGALLHQKGVLVLHASAVSLGDRALVIAGRSSSGKSTLAASLSNKGYPLVTDDLSALHATDSGYFIHPGIPHIKLWKDVIEKMQLEKDLKRIRPKIEKYRKPSRQSFSDKPLRVLQIIALESKNSSGIEILNVKGSPKFELLHQNTYRYQFLRGLQKTQSHFQSVSDLSNRIELFKVRRPSSPLLIDELADLVIEKIIRSTDVF